MHGEKARLWWLTEAVKTPREAVVQSLQFWQYILLLSWYIIFLPQCKYFFNQHTSLSTYTKCMCSVLNVFFEILYSAIHRQLLMCYHPSSCNILETRMADWLVEIMPTVELIKYIWGGEGLMQRFLRAFLAPCTHGVIPLISMDSWGDPQVLVNQYVVKSLLQLVLWSL